MQADALRDLLEQVSARLRPFFGGSLLIFLVTGTHLMLINESYLGLGNIFGNSWSALIVVKHVLVLAFLALAVYSERAFLSQISVQGLVERAEIRKVADRQDKYQSERGRNNKGLDADRVPLSEIN